MDRPLVTRHRDPVPLGAQTDVKDLGRVGPAPQFAHERRRAPTGGTPPRGVPHADERPPRGPGREDAAARVAREGGERGRVRDEDRDGRVRRGGRVVRGGWGQGRGALAREGREKHELDLAGLAAGEGEQRREGGGG